MVYRVPQVDADDLVAVPEADLALKASQIHEVDDDARWELARICSEIVRRCTGNSKRLRAAAAEIGLSVRTITDHASTWNIWKKERLPMSYTAHRDLGFLANSLEVDKFVLADRIVAWAQNRESQIAADEHRGEKLILYPSATLVRAYRKAFAPSTRQVRTISVSVTKLRRIQDLLRQSGHSEAADELARLLRLRYAKAGLNPDGSAVDEDKGQSTELLSAQGVQGGGERLLPLPDGTEVEVDSGGGGEGVPRTHSDGANGRVGLPGAGESDDSRSEVAGDSSLGGWRGDAHILKARLEKLERIRVGHSWDCRCDFCADFYDLRNRLENRQA